MNLHHTFFNVELVIPSPEANAPLERAVAVGNPGREFNLRSRGTFPGQVDHAATREHRPLEISLQHGFAQESKRV